MTRLCRRLRSDDGLTLVELLVVMGLTAVIASATLSTLSGAFRAQRFALSYRADTDEARVALYRLRRELRGASRVQTDSDTRKIRFWTDSNGDRMASPAEQITYALVAAPGGAALQRWTDAAATPVTMARSLALVDAFTYSPAPSLRTRVVTVTYSTAPRDAAGPKPFTFTASVSLRSG